MACYVLQEQTIPRLNPDFICGVCEQAYSNKAAILRHLASDEHRSNLTLPSSRAGVQKILCLLDDLGS